MSILKSSTHKCQQIPFGMGGLGFSFFLDFYVMDVTYIQLISETSHGTQQLCTYSYAW